MKLTIQEIMDLKNHAEEVEVFLAAFKDEIKNIPRMNSKDVDDARTSASKVAWYFKKLSLLIVTASIKEG